MTNEVFTIYRGPLPPSLPLLDQPARTEGRTLAVRDAVLQIERIVNERLRDPRLPNPVPLLMTAFGNVGSDSPLSPLSAMVRTASERQSRSDAGVTPGQLRQRLPLLSTNRDLARLKIATGLFSLSEKVIYHLFAHRTQSTEGLMETAAARMEIERIYRLNPEAMPALYPLWRDRLLTLATEPGETNMLGELFANLLVRVE